MFATIGAGPETNNPFKPGKLVGDINRDRDLSRTIDNANTSDELLKVPGGDEDAAIEALFAAEANYDDSEAYKYFPNSESEGRNSNSFASGILHATSFEEFSTPTRAPGFDIPVPSGSFKKPEVTVQECPNWRCPQ